MSRVFENFKPWYRSFDLSRYLTRLFLFFLVIYIVCTWSNKYFVFVSSLMWTLKVRCHLLAACWYSLFGRTCLFSTVAYRYRKSISIIEKCSIDDIDFSAILTRKYRIWELPVPQFADIEREGNNRRTFTMFWSSICDFLNSNWANQTINRCVAFILINGHHFTWLNIGILFQFRILPCCPVDFIFLNHVGQGTLLRMRNIQAEVGM